MASVVPGSSCRTSFLDKKGIEMAYNSSGPDSDPLIVSVTNDTLE